MDCRQIFAGRLEENLKIAFWSNVRGRSGVTTNMVCISALAAIAGAGKSVLLENHYSYKNIASMVLPGEQIEQLKESGRYYNREGIEYVLKGLYSGEDGSELLRHATMPLYIRVCTTCHKAISLTKRSLIMNLALFIKSYFII